MSEVDAYGLLMTTLDSLEETSMRIKAERDEALKLLRRFRADPQVGEFLERLANECAVTSH